MSQVYTLSHSYTPRISAHVLCIHNQKPLTGIGSCLQFVFNLGITHINNQVYRPLFSHPGSPELSSSPRDGMQAHPQLLVQVCASRVLVVGGRRSPTYPDFCSCPSSFLLRPNSQRKP